MFIPLFIQRRYPNYTCYRPTYRKIMCVCRIFSDGPVGQTHVTLVNFSADVRTLRALDTPTGNKPHTKPTHITVDARNGPRYARIPCTFIKCLNSRVEVPFRKQHTLKAPTLNSTLVYKDFKGFSRKIFRPSTDFVYFLS